jgi:hypothetical protein
MTNDAGSPRLAMRSVAVIATAVGAVAVGAFAIGALAIWRLAIKSVVIDHAEFKSLSIGDLTVAKVRAGEVTVTGSIRQIGNDADRHSGMIDALQGSNIDPISGRA